MAARKVVLITAARLLWSLSTRLDRVAIRLFVRAW
jgi:hypothetical protein